MLVVDYCQYWQLSPVTMLEVPAVTLLHCRLLFLLEVFRDYSAGTKMVVRSWKIFARPQSTRATVSDACAAEIHCFSVSLCCSLAMPKPGS